MRFILFAAMLAAAPLAEAAAQSSPSTQITAAQHAMVNELVGALNANESAALDRWIATYAVMRPTKGAEVWRDWFGRISRTATPLTLERIDPPQQGGEIRVWVRAGDQRLLRWFGLFTDENYPGQATDFIIAVWPAVYDGEVSVASNADIARLTEARVRFGGERDEFSGTVLVAHNGELVASAAAGRANSNAPFTNDTRFHVGSMGKMFTAVAIGRLIQDGRLSFSTRLIEVLPVYPNREAAEAITIAHLLSHSSGISLPYQEPAGPTDLDPERVSDSVARIAAAPLVFEPGSRGAYSNEGFVLLGAVIEAVTGRSYYDVVAETVFEPAGMINTAFDRPGELPPGTATGYRYAPEDALGVRPRQPNTPFLVDRGSPAGGAYSTTEDLTRFITAFRDGRLLSADLTRALITPEPNGLQRYAKGFFAFERGGRLVVGHAGGGPNSGINANLEIVWDTGWSVATGGNYDAPAAQDVSRTLMNALATLPE